MVTNVGGVLEKLDGLSVGAIYGWNSSQPSLTCDDYGVMKLLCWTIAVATVVSEVL